MPPKQLLVTHWPLVEQGCPMSFLSSLSETELHPGSGVLEPRRSELVWSMVPSLSLSKPSEHWVLQSPLEQKLLEEQVVTPQEFTEIQLPPWQMLCGLA